MCWLCNPQLRNSC